MSNLLDLATIKFELKLKEYTLAKVTLDWQGEFEVRFCRLTLRPDNTLWFQPPALKEYRWAKCFGIPDVNKWKAFEIRVIKQFLQECEIWVEEGYMTQEFFEKIKDPPIREEITEEDMDRIDKNIT